MRYLFSPDVSVDLIEDRQAHTFAGRALMLVLFCCVHTFGYGKRFSSSAKSV